MNEVKVLANRYQIGASIGHGGMADVFVGQDLRLGRKVAVKILKSELASDPVFLARFRREAQSSAMLNNPQIVQVFDTGEEIEDALDGSEIHIPYIVMEYVEGKTLRDILNENQKLSQSHAITVTLGVLNALSYSHKMGIIHRDIKPGNIMIDQSGSIKVMDFGIARAMADSAATMTQSQGVVGTAHYLSPEQARGENVDSRSDIYAVGCLLFELLTGRPPFQGDSPVSIAYQHVKEPAPKASLYNRNISSDVERVIDKALEKDVDYRYSSASEFAADLKLASQNRLPQINDDLVDKTQIISPSEMADINKQASNIHPRTSSNNNRFDASINNPQRNNYNQGGVNDLDDNDDKKNKKLIFVALGIIAVVIIAAVVVLALSANKKEDVTVKTVKVPQVSITSTKVEACSLIDQAGLVCETANDTDSLQDAGTVTKTDPQPGTEVDEGSTVTIYLSTGPSNSNVPDVAGMSLTDARNAIEQAGYKANTVTTTQDCTTGTSTEEKNACKYDSGKIVGTSPAANADEPKGTLISLVLASGKVHLPDFKGKTKDQINPIITQLGLTANFEEEESSISKEGTSFSQTPAAGIVDTKTSVTIKIATVAKVEIPAITGKSEAVAVALLEQAGFVASVKYDSSASATSTNDGTVAQVLPDEGSSVAKGSTVKIIVYKAKESSSSSSSSSTSKNSSNTTTK